MAETQHIYSGEGSPYDLNIQATIGSHYINELNPGETWIVTWHDPEEPSTEWLKLEQILPPLVTEGLYTMDEVFWGNLDWVTTGGTFRIGGDGPVYSNVELEQAGGYRSHTSAQPFRVQVAIGTGGEAIITVTPLFHTMTASAG